MIDEQHLDPSGLVGPLAALHHAALQPTHVPAPRVDTRPSTRELDLYQWDPEPTASHPDGES